MKPEESEKLFDQFAGLAMQAMISKRPFYDAQGEFGKGLKQDHLTEIKKNIALAAYEYASYMLIARTEKLEWLKENEEHL